MDAQRRNNIAIGFAIGMTTAALGSLALRWSQAEEPEMHEALERERLTEMDAATAPWSEPPRYGSPAPPEQARHGDSPVDGVAPSPPLAAGALDGAAAAPPELEAAPREIPWHMQPSERALLHYLRCEAEFAEVEVDPLLVAQLWRDDRGVRRDLALFLDAWWASWEAWDQRASAEIQERLEEERVRAMARLWSHYSPAAYAAFMRSYGE